MLNCFTISTLLYQKPTGQETDLELIDAIVKAHESELKVQTKESEGISFIILLPENTN